MKIKVTDGTELKAPVTECYETKVGYSHEI